MTDDDKIHTLGGLTQGTMLSHYKIIEKIGAGGMGEVYRARDTRLDRIVAVKVLLSHSSINSEMRARFRREARTISSLNHSNVCTLYDIGNENGVDFLVMEFLEGEPLNERLKKTRLDIVDALKFGAQIVGALEAAHRHNLVHRDLKPSNIFLTKEGAKLLDFGLAKVQDEKISVTDDKTRTSPVTETGVIVGTLQYMPPEQLDGRETDARSDIFSFGVTFYEMITGRRAFEGNSKASLIGSIMKDEPRDISELQPASPPALDRLTSKCLRKDPEERWQTATDLKDELEWIASTGPQTEIPQSVASPHRMGMQIGWSVAIVATLISVILAAMMFISEKPEPLTARFELSVPLGLSNMTWPMISPDGKIIAFRATNSLGKEQIYVRPLNSTNAYPLYATESTRRPFWSPDSKYLGFFKDKRLYKIPVSGGHAQLICEANGVDGSWGSTGIILFDGHGGDSIRQVPAEGGVATAATMINRELSEQAHAWPRFLTDGDHFFYLAYAPPSVKGIYENPTLKVGSLSGSSDKSIGIVETKIEYTYAGYLLFVRGGTLFAQEFDSDKFELVGEPIPVTTNVATFGQNRSNVSISNNGTLVYMVSTKQDISEPRFVVILNWSHDWDQSE